MTNIDEPTTQPTTQPITQPSAPPNRDGSLARRTVLRGATLGGLSLPLLAACGGGGDSETGSDETGSDDGGSASSGSTSAGSGSVTVAASDVPVGGGAVLTDDKLVVTQPTKGEYKAFTAVCTHAQCLVTKVEDEKIVCPCHGSHFSISDGSPVSGPAKSALAAKKVSVKGGQITVA